MTSKRKADQGDLSSSLEVARQLQSKRTNCGTKQTKLNVMIKWIEKNFPHSVSESGLFFQFQRDFFLIYGYHRVQQLDQNLGPQIEKWRTWSGGTT